MQQTNGKVHETARRILQEKAELGPEQAKEAAAAVLALFARVEPKELKRFAWYAELKALSVS